MANSQKDMEKKRGDNMNKSTPVSREEMNDLDWLARNVHEWPSSSPDRNFDNASLNGWEFSYGEFRNGKSVVTKAQWLARRAKLQNKPSWDDAPEWANWLCQRDDGMWFWCIEESRVSESGWETRHEARAAYPSGDQIPEHVLGDWRDTLEKRPETNEMPSHSNQPKPSTDIQECAEVKQFEPFVSVEDAAAKQPAITTSKYTKTIHGVSVDVYDVLQAWGVSNPALQHLIKKALQCGQRGHKDNAQDLQDIIDSAIRAKELECQQCGGLVGFSPLG